MFAATLPGFVDAVQIPLWTIVTEQQAAPEGRSLCSDSSMDDCNQAARLFSREKGGCSDSSMDDCNQVIILRHVNGLSVQIPLWTIVTSQPGQPGAFERRSDSSMDDCNAFYPMFCFQGLKFRFLYGRL